MKLNKLDCVVMKLFCPGDLVAVFVLGGLSLLVGSKACVIARAGLIVVLIVLSIISYLVVSSHVVVFVLSDCNRLLRADSADSDYSLESTVIVEGKSDDSQNDYRTKDNGNDLSRNLFHSVSLFHAMCIFFGRLCNTCLTLVTVLFCLRLFISHCIHPLLNEMLPITSQHNNSILIHLRFFYKT